MCGTIFNFVDSGLTLFFFSVRFVFQVLFHSQLHLSFLMLNSPFLSSFNIISSSRRSLGKKHTNPLAIRSTLPGIAIIRGVNHTCRTWCLTLAPQKASANLVALLHAKARAIGLDGTSGIELVRGVDAPRQVIGAGSKAFAAASYRWAEFRAVLY